MQPIIVPRGKTVELPVSLGFNLSGDTIISQIRVSASPTSTLIASWAVSFETDGKNGELILTLPASVTLGIVQNIGYMNLKRTAGGPVVDFFDTPLDVLFTNP